MANNRRPRTVGRPPRIDDPAHHRRLALEEQHDREMMALCVAHVRQERPEMSSMCDRATAGDRAAQCAVLRTYREICPEPAYAQRRRWRVHPTARRQWARWWGRGQIMSPAQALAQAMAGAVCLEPRGDGGGVYLLPESPSLRMIVAPPSEPGQRPILLRLDVIRVRSKAPDGAVTALETALERR